MASVMKAEMFLMEKVRSYDLIKVSVVASPGSQVLRAIVEKIYSARKGVDYRSLGEEIEFVHAPGHWGAVALSVGERALVFVSSIAGRLYEDPWKGHMVIEERFGRQYASYPSRELWLRDDVPVSIRKRSQQDPERPYATAIQFEPLEAHLVELINCEQGRSGEDG